MVRRCFPVAKIAGSSVRSSHSGMLIPADCSSARPSRSGYFFFFCYLKVQLHA